MTDSRCYWLWLQKALGAGARIEEICAAFSSPKQMYEEGEMAWRISGALTAKQIDRLCASRPEENEPVLTECSRNGWTVLTPEDACYPARLRTLPDFPAALFVRGDPGVLAATVPVAIVGTRKASCYGLEVTRRLAFALAKAGAVIVSGGALGVDTSAHMGAILAGGQTVCFLGCGLAHPYLMENEPIRQITAENGAVVSEYPPHTGAGKATFPIRNRLISGFSLGTVVIEAGERSGSLITARCAIEQGRDVFAVAGDIISSAFTGANKLIRDGAKPVFTPMDILEEYALCYPDALSLEDAQLPLSKSPGVIGDLDLSSLRTKSAPVQQPKPQKHAPPAKKRPPPADIGETQRLVYAALQKEPVQADELAEALGLPLAQLLGALTQLELTGYAVSESGRRYRLA